MAAYLNRVCSAFCNVYFYFRDCGLNTVLFALMASSEENKSTADDGQSDVSGKILERSLSPRKSSEESDKHLDELSEITADIENLDVTAGEDDNPISKPNAKSEKPNYFKSLSKSAHRIFKGLKSPKGSKRPPTRPTCSSDIAVKSWRASLPSPIRNLEEYYWETSPDLFGEVSKESSEVDRIDYANLAEDEIIPTFLSSRTCYDVMPVSGKVVVLSVELMARNAFEALVNNELRAALLWDESQSSFVGMLTISDFINVLRHYYNNSPENMNDIENQSISTWRNITRISKPMVKINAMDNLAQATKLTIEEGVHRLPVLDEEGQRPFFVLTKEKLLNYLYNNIMQRFGNTIVRTPSFLTKTIRELGVGTFSDIAKVTFDTKVIEALDLFVQRRVSGLPIVDENNTIIDIFSKFDVFALAKEQTYHNLDMTINEAIERGKVHENVYGCTLDDTLGTVISTIVTLKVHRLVVRDEKKCVLGIVSVSDILKFLVVQPLNKLEETSAPSTDTIEEAPEGAVGGIESDDSVFLDAKPKSSDASNEPDGEEVSENSSSKLKEDSVAEEEE